MVRIGALVFFLCGVAACGDDGDASGPGGGGGEGGASTASSATTTSAGPTTAASSSSSSTTSSSTTTSSTGGGGGEGGGGGAGGGGVEAFVAPLLGDGPVGDVPASVLAVAVGDDDALFAAVEFGGAVDFLGPLDPLEGDNVAIVKLSPDGDVAWQRVFGVAQGVTSGASLAALPDGGVLLATSPVGDLDLGSEVLVALGEQDAAVVRVDATGEVVWSRRFGGADTEGAGSIAVAGDVALFSGFCISACNFGGEDLTSGGAAMVLAAYGLDDGEHLWSRRIPIPDTAELAATSDDRFIAHHWVPAAGATIDAVTFGAGSTRRVAVTYDVATGQALEGTVLAEGELGSPIAGGGGFFPDPSGRLALAYTYDGALSIGGDPAEAPDGQDAFVASITADALDWVHLPSGTGDERVFGLAGSPNGRLAYSGWTDGEVELGDLTLTSDGSVPRTWIGVLDAASGRLTHAAETTHLDMPWNTTFLSDDRIVVTGPGGLAVLDLGL